MKWDSVEFIHEASEFQKKILFETQKAQKNIFIEFYIFNFDSFGRVFLQTLKRATERGVYVQLLIDALGSGQDLVLIEAFCKAHNINYKIFRKPWTRFFRSATPITNFFKRLNRRNHRKLVIFDEVKALVGSFNLTELDWRDSAAFVSGEPIKNIILAHRYSWLRAQKMTLPRKGTFELKKTSRLANPLLRINSTLRLRQHIYKDFIRRIRHSRKNIFLVTPYFIPRYRFLKSLEKAAERGVNTQIILPLISDVKIVQLASLGILNQLSEKGVRIYLYSKKMLHAKYSIIDDWSCLGSHNLNHRSFLHDLELDLVFNDPNHVHELERQFFIDSSHSILFNIKNYSRFEILTGRFLYLFRYWL